MKAAFIASVIALAASQALAGGNSNNSDNVTNNYDQRNYSTAYQTNSSAEANALGLGVGVGYGGQGGSGGAGGAGGQGGAAAVVGSGNSAQQQAAFGGSASAAGGAGGVSSALGGTAGSNATAMGGQGSGNATTVAVDASVHIPKPASAPAYAPDGTAPRTSCRIFVGLGGTGRDGSLSGGFPVGNDQTCMSGAMIEAMDKANKVAPGSFLIGDYLMAICKMESMGETAGCKAK